MLSETLINQITQILEVWGLGAGMVGYYDWHD